MQNTTAAQTTGSHFCFRTQGNYNCDSKNVIYLLEGTMCHAQYIGQTETATAKSATTASIIQTRHRTGTSFRKICSHFTAVRFQDTS